MARRLLESLSGVGTVYSGDTLLRTTPYQVFLWVDDDAAKQPSASAPVSIEGHIDITGIAEAVVLAGPDALTLRLQDGRRLRFTLTGTSGRILGKGGLEIANT